MNASNSIYWILDLFYILDFWIIRYFSYTCVFLDDDHTRFGGTYTKIGTIQRRLAWPLRKDDTQNREAFHIFKKKKKNYFCWLQLFGMFQVFRLLAFSLFLYACKYLVLLFYLETASHRRAAHFTLTSLLSKYNFKRGGCGVWCAFRTNNLCRIRRSPALR